MKPTLLFLFFSFYSFEFASAQNPSMKMWDYRFGGTSWDFLTSILQAPDSGFLLIGFSKSGVSGDKTQPNWDTAQFFYDFWVVKTDADGIKQWDLRCGGIEGEGNTCAIVNSEGNYIIGGTSSSGQTGNISQASLGNNDFWILKVDPSGNILWDKRFGGTLSDELIQIRQTSDGGYILGGQSNSDVGGDKSQPTWGLHDYWIVKIDSIGNLLWEKRYGGNAEDYLFSLLVTNDNGFLLAGQSGSSLSGDKTETTYGGYDYWIVKTDSLGNILWDETLGSNLSDYLNGAVTTDDGGYLLAGIAPFGISVDKTMPGWGGDDFWIVKVDSLGNNIWDKTYGGSDGEDDLTSIIKTASGDFLISGTSYSSISGDKTENNLGIEETWVIEIDNAGNKLWDKTLLTNNIIFHDESGYAIPTLDGCYLFANYTWAGIGGHKTQPNWDTMNYSPDYWIIKFCGTIEAGFTSPLFVCPGTCIDFLNLSSNATNYQWYFPGAVPNSSTGVNPANICYSNPGNYDATLIATNANGSDTLTIQNYITVYPFPPQQSITQSGDSLFAIAGSTSYQWFFNGNIIPGATDYFYIATISGNYSVVATDNNGCEVEAAITNVIAGLTLVLSKGGGVVFPNPVLETLTVIGFTPSGTSPSVVPSTDEISIYNLIGEKIPLAATCCPWTVDCRPLPPGLYYLELTAGEKIFRSKFVKQ